MGLIIIVHVKINYQNVVNEFSQNNIEINKLLQCRGKKIFRYLFQVRIIERNKGSYYCLPLVLWYKIYLSVVENKIQSKFQILKLSYKIKETAKVSDKITD